MLAIIVTINVIICHRFQGCIVIQETDDLEYTELIQTVHAYLVLDYLL